MKSSRQRKNYGKSTYPPPADGLYVRFLCKGRGLCIQRCRPGAPRARLGKRQFHKMLSFAKKCSVVTKRREVLENQRKGLPSRYHWAERVKIQKSSDFPERDISIFSVHGTAFHCMELLSIASRSGRRPRAIRGSAVWENFTNWHEPNWLLAS